MSSLYCALHYRRLIIVFNWVVPCIIVDQSWVMIGPMVSLFRGWMRKSQGDQYQIVDTFLLINIVFQHPVSESVGHDHFLLRNSSTDQWTCLESVYLALKTWSSRWPRTQAFSMFIVRGHEKSVQISCSCTGPIWSVATGSDLGEFILIRYPKPRQPLISDFACSTALRQDLLPK